MELLGNTIQGILKLRHKLNINRSTAKMAQREELRKLITKAKDTAFGKFYNFQDLLDHPAPEFVFRDRIPLHTYNDIQKRWWEQQQKFPDITWPGQPSHYALSSGTTGPSSKRIPVTNDFLTSIRQVSIDQISELATMDLPPQVFESEALAISSSADLKPRNGHLEGEISGINVHNSPEWSSIFLKPGKDIAAIDDWEQRTDIIAKEAPKWDIGILSGIPSWVQLCLRKILEVNEVEYIDDLWPNVHAYISGGVAFSTYASSFKKLFRKEIKIIDTYLASEGFFAFGSSEAPMEMRLALSHGYFFEFIPFLPKNINELGHIKPSALSVGIDKVEKGQEYALVVSSCAGAWRYIIGDLIEFTDTDKYTIQISGRVKFFMNVVGSQLSEDKMNSAISHLSKQKDLDVNEFMVTCKQINGAYYHVWTLVTEQAINTEEASRIIDEYLKLLNKNYKVARGKALVGVKCRILKPLVYRKYLGEKKKIGGQVKTPKVMDKKTNQEMEAILELN